MRRLSLLWWGLLTLSTASATLPDNYQTLNAREKQDILWDNTVTEMYSKLPADNPGVLELMKLLSWRYLLPSFKHVSDELPLGRKKLIHTYGSVAKVRWVADGDHPYTGVFKTGAVGVTRIGLARQSSSPITPGMGLKLLIDGVRSVNLHIMYRLEGQGSDSNIFKHTFTNDLPRPSFIPFDLFTGSFAIAVKYLKKGSSPLYLPPSHLSKVDRYGDIIIKNNFPEVLEFRPTEDVQLSSDSKIDYRKKMAGLMPGNVLYEIYAKEKRGKEGAFTKIGELILESEFVASKYGDQKLFFQHNIY